MTGKEFKAAIKTKGYSIVAATKKMSLSRPYLYELFEKDVIPEKYAKIIQTLPDNTASQVSTIQDSDRLLARFIEMLEKMQNRLDDEKKELYKIIEEQRDDKDVLKGIIRKNKITA